MYSLTHSPSTIFESLPRFSVCGTRLPEQVTSKVLGRQPEQRWLCNLQAVQNRTLLKILIEPHAFPHSLSTCNVADRGNAPENKIVGRQTTARLGNSQIVISGVQL